MKSKSCVLNPIPTNLVKQCLPEVADFLEDLMNLSLTSGVVPDCFKRAVFRPLLRKSGIDPNVLGNNRPVSNSPFLSKVV